MKKYLLMKNELTIQNFKDIPRQALQDINGGFWQFVIPLALVAIDEIVGDWDNFKNGLMGRPEEKTNS